MDRTPSFNPPPIDGAPVYRRWLPALLGGGLVLLFLAAPWPIADKAHAAMRGLCAQNPQHTLTLGGQLLPFDARMSGVYLGLIAILTVIAARGGMRRAGTPTRKAIVVLGVLLMAMAIDGANSLLTDLRLPHLWAPTNTLRLITGTGAGLALGALLAYLVASTIWRRPRWLEPAASGRDIAAALPIAGALAMLAASGWGAAYPIVATLLVVAGAGTMCALLLMILLLARDVANRSDSIADLRGHGIAGVALGLLVVAGLAAGRYAMETWLGLPAGPI